MAIPEQVLFRDLGGEGVLLHLGTGQYYGLDELGTMIWTLLSGGSSLAEIEQRVLEEYDATADQVRGDLDRLLNDLCRRNLLIRAEDSG